MSEGKIEKIYKAMQEILPNYPEGMRRNNLIAEIKKKLPDSKTGTIVTNLPVFTRKYPNEFSKKRVKGEGVLYFPAQNNTADEKGDNIAIQKEKGKYKEEDFYPSFAEYLQYGDDNNDGEYHHLDECTNAIELGGGSKLQGKWGTPDVIGLLTPYDDDAVQFPDEIVSAEIKIEDSRGAIITAFGQACAYRLFSHKTYLVIPESTGDNRIEKLCQIFGIGLVYFDPTQKPEVSIYTLKLPAQKHSPDMFYVNEFIKGEIANKLYDKNIRKRK